MPNLHEWRTNSETSKGVDSAIVFSKQVVVTQIHKVCKLSSKSPMQTIGICGSNLRNWSWHGLKSCHYSSIRIRFNRFLKCKPTFMWKLQNNDGHVGWRLKDRKLEYTNFTSKFDRTMNYTFYWNNLNKNKKPQIQYFEIELNFKVIMKIKGRSQEAFRT